MWFPNRIFNRERTQPGSIWSLLLSLTTFILLCVALGGLSSSSGGIMGVYIAELDFTDAVWPRITSSSTSRYSNRFSPIQRMNLYNNCEGRELDNGFNRDNCYRVGHGNSLDMRYIVSHGINSFSSQPVTKSEVNAPQGAVISRTNANAIIVLTTIACVLSGWAFFGQLFKMPWFVLPKVLAVILLLVANIMAHVLAKRMVNKLNDHYGSYGIQANLGSRYLAIVWDAFSLLLVSTALQLTNIGNGSSKNSDENQQPKFDPEAMRRGGYRNGPIHQGQNETIQYGNNTPGAVTHGQNKQGTGYYPDHRMPPAPPYEP